jgi:hypothetical protein
MQSMIKKILPILILGFLIEFSAPSLTFFKANKTIVDSHSVIAAETRGDDKGITSESGTALNLKMSEGQDYIEQKWQLLKGILRWDIGEILVGTFLSVIGLAAITLARDLETARQIQSFILPQKQFDIKGVHLAAHYVPMAAVAGDFYDFARVDEKRQGILVVADAENI